MEDCRELPSTGAAVPEKGRRGSQPGAARIQLWCAFYREIQDPRLLDRYRLLLSAEELERETRFRFADDRLRHLVSRALLRTVLSAHVDNAVEPSQWRFATNPFGRPEIANDDMDLRRISFNLSHTAGVIVIAIARDRTVGADVEVVGGRERTERIASRYFASSEAAALEALPARQQQQRFFEYWTLKESYIKARGEGLSVPLDQFSFRFPEEHSIEIAMDPRLEDSPAHWSFWQLRLRESFLSAICAERMRADFEADPEVIEAVPLLRHTAVEVIPFRRSGPVPAAQ